MQLLLASPRCAPMIVNGAFSGLTALRTSPLRGIWNNQLTVINNGTFTGLHRDIDSNFITHIAPGSFVGLTSLSTLYVCVCIGHCVLPRVVAAE
eukprot:m.103629 g.103629  ORF g.103629 m.103629 type:complete len:94 (-) comp14154_c0_seq6:302-583(-)